MLYALDMPSVSVILATFEQPNALALAIAGYRRQSFADFELIVADDGSGEATARVVEDARRAAPFPVKHVWQENKGFRRARITNEGVRKAEGRILLISDGDCIPHADFVRVHAEACGPRSFCAGGYVMLSEAQTRTLTPRSVLDGAHEAYCTPAERRRMRRRHWANRLAVFFGNMKKPKVYGCNLSVDREAFVAVNGLDENFDGFGKEDSDLRNRLRRSGARPVSVWGRAWVYHLHDVIDPELKARRIPRRDPYPYFGRPDVPVRCLNGLVKP